ncbi:hypothetical protein B0H14DRAFT_3130039 [Mycena olivaceomarginata]|nr:hypothetical protein B0H14DRAFT_3130039 [Mycena olivaceomarginata]
MYWVKLHKYEVPAGLYRSPTPQCNGVGISSISSRRWLSYKKSLGSTKLEKSPKPRKKGRKNLNKLKPLAAKDQKVAKEAKQRETAQLKARARADNCDMFILPDVDLNVLKARPKNTDELKSLAAQRIAEMGDQLEDARSAIFKDKNGITLACVFAHRIPGAQKMHGLSYPGPEGRTIMDVLGTHDEAFSEDARRHLQSDITTERHGRLRFTSAACLKVAYPEYHAKYTKAFKAGV